MKNTIARFFRWLGGQVADLMTKSLAKHIDIPERLQLVAPPAPPDPRYTRWKKVRANYRLIGVGGSFVYELKEEAGTEDDGHWLCPKCFDQECRVSVLQHEEGAIWGCPACTFIALTDESPWIDFDDD